MNVSFCFQLMATMRPTPNGHVSSPGHVTPCIEDPLDVKNDVGRGSFLFYRVKGAFEEAYVTLTKLCSGARLPPPVVTLPPPPPPPHRATYQKHEENPEKRYIP